MIINFRKFNNVQTGATDIRYRQKSTDYFHWVSLLCSPPLRTRKYRPSFWLVDMTLVVEFGHLVKPFPMVRRSLLEKSKMALTKVYD